MLRALWSFLLDNPDGPVPFPWERCYDGWSGMLYYKNTIDETMVVDLRRRVNLGGGLYHNSNWWHFLTGRYRNFSMENDDEMEEEPPYLIDATCCGPLFYLVVPELVHLCPVCDAFIHFYG